MSIENLRLELQQKFPERQRVIDGALAAVLSGEHVLLLGPPGTAKSALARALASALGGTYFERLLTKFSTPDELFGPISLKALEEDRFRRVTAKMVPEANFCFIDEVFKANSAILNALLTIMNERIFHNDGAAVPCPLVTLFGASNELPDGRELEAMHDRFLVRFDVQPIVQLSNLKQVMLSPDPEISAHMTLDQLSEAQQAASKVIIPDSVFDGLITIREGLRTDGINASDRRWKKSLKLVKASAYMAGKDKAEVDDLHVLVDTLWREPRDRGKVLRIVGQVADPASAFAVEIVEAARETTAKLIKDKGGDRGKYLGTVSKAIEDFDDQINKLNHLFKDGGPRAKINVAEALREVRGFRAEAARVASESLGLSGKGARMSAIVDEK